MTITIFALDTTGLYDFQRPREDPIQPRIVAMSAGLYTPKWELKAWFEFITKPDGSASTAGAQSVHGITERERELYGVDILFLMGALMRLVRSSNELATFNMQFAKAMIELEFQRLNNAAPADWTRGGLKRTCIRDEAGARWNEGRGMNLSAAHELATGISYDKPLKDKTPKDVRAAMRVLSELRRKV